MGRLAFAFRSLAASLFALGTFACSSGLEGVDPGDTTDSPDLAPSTNLRFAFDPNVVLTQAVTDVQVAGGLLPTLDGSPAHPVAFCAFVTATAIQDLDDPVSDTNGVADVFVAVVDSRDIDTNAFSYAIAGKMRHTRCVTCHQMNVDVVADPSALPPLPFLTQAHFEDGGGLPPLGDFGDANCKNCHFEDWEAPGPTFDLRNNTTRTLFTRAQVPPGGAEVHFSTDPRVLWALDSGQTPFGGAADDDHDGIDEPEDHDNVRRHVPGGKKAFLAQLRGWLDTRDPETNELKFSSAAEAVHDVVLASRVEGLAQAGNGAARAPSLVYVPNVVLRPGVGAPPVGTLYVAFQSDATDLVGGGTGSFTDVFRVTIDVFLTSEGKVDLVYRNGSQIQVSRSAMGADPKGNSIAPDIGGDGDRIAFVSDALDLVAGFPTSCRPEVYLWDDGAGIFLVSHVPGNSSQPGNAGAIQADLSADGEAVSFESDATNLVSGDLNGKRDVFYAVWPGLDVARASVDSAGNEFTGHAVHGSLFHAAGEVKVAFAVQEDTPPPVVGVQCPDVTVALNPTQDGSIRSGATTTSTPTGSLFAGTTGSDGDGERRALLEFDLSSIPPGSTINSARLQMTVTLVPGGTACPSPVNNSVALRVLTSSWAEDATWNNRIVVPPTAWGAAGGDFLGASATTLVTGLGLYQWTGLQADVQAWVDGTRANNGWILDGSNSACSARAFGSRESVSAQRPTLIVDYTPPAPLPRGGAPSGPSSVFLRDTMLGITLPLDRIVSPEGTLAARELDIDGTALLARSANPVISPYGNAVLFESMAQNLDFTRAVDLNRAMDVVLVDLLQFEAQGFVLPYRLSVTSDGGEADGSSRAPRFAGFRPATDDFPLGLALFATQALNLGDTDPADPDLDGVPEADSFLLSFLSEGGSVLADFRADPERQGMNRGVAFESLSSGRPENFLWDFGDGTPTSTKKAPVHAYAAPGVYSVSLTVSGELGTDDRTRTQYVRVLGPVMAGFATTKDTTSAPAQGAAVAVSNATVVAGAIDDADPGSVLRFDLDSSASSEFPDEFRWTVTPVDASGNKIGSTVTVSREANPQGVTIDKVGLYDLALEATGPGGKDEVAQRVEVYQRVAADFTSNPGGSPVRGPADLAVQFTDTSSGAQDTFLWDFGDGVTSTEQNPQHTFDEGVWEVTLTVNGKGTDTSTTLGMPIVADGPVSAVFSANPRGTGSSASLFRAGAIEGPGGIEVDFLNLSQSQGGQPLFYRWDFGAGAQNTAGQTTVQDPQGILYQRVGPQAQSATYTIQLITSTIDPAPASCLGQPLGTCSSVLVAVIAYPAPTADFTAGLSFASAPNRPPHAVQFNGLVTGDGVTVNPTYQWLRSEPNQAGASLVFATELDPLFEFEDPGTYKIALRVETDGPGGSRQAVVSAEQDVIVTASTLSDWYDQAIAQASGSLCVNCHKGLNAPAGLRWDIKAEVFNRIVQDENGAPVFSTRCNTESRLVEPGDPESSVVFNVLRKPPGPLCTISMRVNLNGDESAKDGHLAVLRSWIRGGALNN